LKADRGGVGELADNGGDDNKGRKERDHGGVGGRLGEVEEIVLDGTEVSAMEDAGEAKQYGRDVDQDFHWLRKAVTD
jgi:hypothetical protein